MSASAARLGAGTPDALASLPVALPGESGVSPAAWPDEPRLLTPEALALQLCPGKAADYVRHAALLIGNVSTQILLLDTGKVQLPISVNDGGERTYPQFCGRGLS